MLTEFILGISELMDERKDLRKEWEPFLLRPSGSHLLIGHLSLLQGSSGVCEPGFGFGHSLTLGMLKVKNRLIDRKQADRWGLGGGG